MKTTNLVRVLLVFIFLSCSDDNGENPAPAVVNSGSVSCDGQTYPTSQGYIILPYNGNDPAYNHLRRSIQLAFSDGTISLNPNNLWIYGSDVHQFIDFLLFTSESNPTVFENTTFSFSDFDAPDPSLPTIIDSRFITGIVAQNETSILAYDNAYTANVMASTGQIHITSFPGGIFFITYSYVGNKGIEVSGSYYGNLTVLQRAYN